MDFNKGSENFKNISKRVGRAAALSLSLLAAGETAAVVPGAAKRPEGNLGPSITGSEKSGTSGSMMEDLTMAKQQWVQNTFEESLRHDYGKAGELLIERTDPSGGKWSFFKVQFRDHGQTNLIGCHQTSDVCINLKLPLGPFDVNPQHRSFFEEAASQAKVLLNVHESSPDPESGSTWLAVPIIRAEKHSTFLLIRPDIMLDKPITAPSERPLGK